jgi:hypothetical protein
MSRVRTKEYHALLDFWRAAPLRQPPYVHKGDSVLLSPDAEPDVCLYSTYHQFVQSEDFGKKKNHRLHLGLLPAPYAGSLAHATVFILMLNSGVSSSTYFMQDHDKEAMRQSINGIRQERMDKRYPWGGLNPFDHWRSKYWFQKLDDIIRLTSVQHKCNYQQALSIVSRRVAVLQLYAYRSQTFGLSPHIRSNLTSSKLILDFAQKCLIPEALDGKTLLVVTRKATSWEVRPHHNVIVYEGSESRGAHMSTKSRGGRAIANHLGLL